MPSLRGVAWRLSALTLLGLAACSGAERLEERDCPPGGTALRYEGFGEPFFERWCVPCHGAPNGASSRAFTTVEAIRADAERIFVNAAGDNTSMPPGPEDPPRAERERLAEWLACGAP